MTLSLLPVLGIAITLPWAVIAVDATFRTHGTFRVVNAAASIDLLTAMGLFAYDALMPACIMLTLGTLLMAAGWLVRRRMRLAPLRAEYPQYRTDIPAWRRPRPGHDQDSELDRHRRGRRRPDRR